MELSKEQATEVLDTFNKWREDREGGVYLGSDVVTASINFAITHLRQSSAPAAVGVPEGWQPIETAPEVEGDTFFCRLAWGPDEDKSTGDGFRWNGRWFAAGLFYAMNKQPRFEFRHQEVSPTHWMAKSAAPSAGNALPADSAAFHDEAWERYQQRASSDPLLQSLSIHQFRAIVSALCDAKEQVK